MKVFLFQTRIAYMPVAKNSGSIQYSYVRADESKITYANPYATGYCIENRGNGIVAGFVFDNRGTISNSYANTELKTDSAYIAGFAFKVNGQPLEAKDFDTETGKFTTVTTGAINKQAKYCLSSAADHDF